LEDIVPSLSQQNNTTPAFRGEWKRGKYGINFLLLEPLAATESANADDENRAHQEMQQVLGHVSLFGWPEKHHPYFPQN
jgi:hypothetical protein